MNTGQLKHIISTIHCIRNYHVEICAIKTLPNVTHRRYPQIYIINTDPIPRPGEHWICLLFLDKLSSEYFDSLGKPINFYGESIQSFIVENSKTCNYISKQLQSNKSDICGQYVLFFSLLCEFVSLYQ